MTDEEIAKELTAHAHEIGSLKHRMDDAEGIVTAVHQLAKEMVGLTKEVSFMGQNIAQLTAKVSTLEAVPGKRWDGLVMALIGAAAGVAISAFLS